VEKKLSGNDRFSSEQQSTIDSLRQTVLDLEEDLKNQQLQHQKLMATLKLYDKDKDDYSSDLFAKIEQNETLQTQLNILVKDHKQNMYKLEETAENLKIMQKRLMDKESQLTELNIEHNLVLKENKALKKDVNAQNNDNKNYKSDMESLVNENQKLSQINEDMLIQMNSLSSKLSELEEESLNKDGSERQRQQQLDDVMLMYQQVCDENQQFKSANQEFNEAHTKLEQ